MTETAQATIDFNNPYHVQLDVFEGPLDLLLHLIKENDVDIFNIPIANITDQYIQYIETMETLNLNVAGEFLLMASTLAHLKSKLLLPPDPTEEVFEDEGTDPREELVRRLLEYQKYKQIAQVMQNRTWLGRDTFIREGRRRKLMPDQPIELAEVSVFKLVEVFHKILNDFQLDESHDVELENFSIADSAVTIQTMLREAKDGKLRFSQLFSKRAKPSYGQVVASFLAILSMMKRGVLAVVQTDDFEEIHLMTTPQFYQQEWTYDGTEFDNA
jgi:segregation and condensation protein A